LELEHFFQNITLGKNAKISSAIRGVLQITQKFNLKTQPQLLMLQKTILYLESCVYIIDKDFDLWIIIKPWIKKWAWKNSSNKTKIKMIGEFCIDSLKKYFGF
jgi:ubiquinone biosynthesis protein